MTGTTPVYGLRYPTSGDAVADVATFIEDLAEDLESTIAGLGGIASPGSWQTPTLGTNVSAYGGGFIAPSYRKVGSEVILRGLIKPTAGTLAAGATIFILPAGFRPTAGTDIQLGYYSTGAGPVNIDTSGDVLAAAGVASGGFLNLSSIRFYID